MTSTRVLLSSGDPVETQGDLDLAPSPLPPFCVLDGKHGGRGEGAAYSCFVPSFDFGIARGCIPECWSSVRSRGARTASALF